MGIAMADDFPSRSLDKVIVRLPDGMRERIKAAADANNRSMNAEIVSTLAEKYPEPSGIVDNLKTLHAMLDEIKGDPSHPRWVDFARLSDDTLHLIKRETAAMKAEDQDESDARR